MKVIISPTKLKGTLDVVSSKSASHRALIAAGLASGKSTLHNLLDSEDITATKNALKALGVKIEEGTIYGGDLKVVETTIHANESGSTLRFMIPIALLFDTAITFTGQGNLPKRPLNLYKDLFNSSILFDHGEDFLPLKVKGPLQGGQYQLLGNVSSQFITGLLFALPLCEGNSTITLNSPLQSKDYVAMTIDTLKRAKITIIEDSYRYIIPGNQHYSPFEITIEGDYSQAAFFMVAGLLTNTITLRNLDVHSKQGDKAIIEIIQAMNGTIACDEINSTVTVTPSKTQGPRVDLANIPDLGPILMVLAALSEGTTYFENTERLRIKESDRLKAMIEILTKFGVTTTLKDHTLSVQGVTSLKGNQTFDGYQDHRIVMALSIAALKADGPITINGAEAIKKSYPQFFKDYTQLGGKIKY